MKTTLKGIVKEYSIRNKNNENIRVYSITNSTGFIPSTEYFSKEVFSKDLSTYKIVEKGMIAYNPSRINVGSVACQDKEKRVIVSPLYVVIKVDSSVLLPQILELFLKSEIGQKQIKSLTSGSVRDSLKYSALERIEINIPSLIEQKEILRNISKLSDIIKKRNQQLFEIENVAKSRFLEMFGNVKSSKKISHFVDSNIVSAKKAYDENTTIKYIDISSVDNKSFSIETITEYCFKDAPSRAQQCVISGDILVSTVRPNLKNIAVVESTDKNLVASSGFCVLRAVKCPKEFLFGIISSDDFTNAMVGLTTGANYPAIKDSDILKYPVPDTSSTNMEFYANFIQQLDKSKFRIKKSLEKLELTYKALLQEYFG